MSIQLMSTMLGLILIFSGCRQQQNPDLQSIDSTNVTPDDTLTAKLPEPCTDGWFTMVENHVQTADDAGHGPDPGSVEWKYSVAFHLGLEGDESAPDPESSEWCDFIDSHIADRMN